MRWNREQSCCNGRCPAEDIAEHKHSALTWRQLLNGSDKRELHRLPRRVARLRIRLGVGEAVKAPVRRGLEPGHVTRRAAFQLRRAGGAELVGQISLLVLAAFERVEAGVGGDTVKPGSKRSALIGTGSLEARETAPGTQIGLLHGIFGFLERAEHARFGNAVNGATASVDTPLPRPVASRYNFIYGRSDLANLRPERSGNVSIRR